MHTTGVAISALGLLGTSAGLIWTAYAGGVRQQLDRGHSVIAGAIVSSIGLVLMTFDF